MAHLIYGPTAAGKSTYARALAAEHNAVRFAIDEWMHALFAADMPERLEMAWALTRVARCQAQVWSIAKQILGTGTDVVLELGLLRANDRKAAAAEVEAAGFPMCFHFVDADLSLRRQRVLRRNAEKGKTYSFDVTPPMFEAMESYFERPSAGELSNSKCIQGQTK